MKITRLLINLCNPLLSVLTFAASVWSFDQGDHGSAIFYLVICCLTACLGTLISTRDIPRYRKERQEQKVEALAKKQAKAKRQQQQAESQALAQENERLRLRQQENERKLLEMEQQLAHGATRQESLDDIFRTARHHPGD